MRKVVLVAAAGVVLVANGWAVVQAWRNRSESLGGRLELTERELALEPMAAESTATVLRLNWTAHTSSDDETRPPAWLDSTKLAELGFDCTMPVTAPSARHHYGAMPSRPAFLALEYAGATGENPDANARARSRLLVVDAAPDARRLRQRYPEPERTIICRGLVRLAYRDRERRSGALLNTPRLEGWIQSLRPAEVFVPLPHNRLLRGLRPIESEKQDKGKPTVPRFALRVCWGANYEPCVEGVRLLKPAEVDVKRP